MKNGIYFDQEEHCCLICRAIIIMKDVSNNFSVCFWVTSFFWWILKLGIGLRSSLFGWPWWILLPCFFGGFWNRLRIGVVWSNKRLVWKFKGIFKIPLNVSMKFDTRLINSIESSMSQSHNKFNLNWIEWRCFTHKITIDKGILNSTYFARLCFFCPGWLQIIVWFWLVLINLFSSALFFERILNSTIY